MDCGKTVYYITYVVYRLSSRFVLPAKVRPAAMKILHKSSSADQPGIFRTYEMLVDFLLVFRIGYNPAGDTSSPAHVKDIRWFCMDALLCQPTHSRRSHLNEFRSIWLT